MPLAVGILHSLERAAEWLAASNLNLGEDVCCIGRRVEDIASPLPPLLSYADVHRRQSERRSLHDAAAGVANHQVHVSQQAPIGQRGQIDEYAGIRPLC